MKPFLLHAVSLKSSRENDKERTDTQFARTKNCSALRTRPYLMKPFLLHAL